MLNQRDLVKFRFALRMIGRDVAREIDLINKVIFKVHENFQVSITQPAKYKAWFDKYDETIEEINDLTMIRSNSLRVSSYQQPMASRFFHNITSMRCFYDYKELGSFSSQKYIRTESDERFYSIYNLLLSGGVVPGKNISYEKYVNIFSELYGSFSNTFVFDLIRKTDSNKNKKRKISKLSRLADELEEFTNLRNFNAFGKIYHTIRHLPSWHLKGHTIIKDKPEFDLIMSSVIGFIRNKSYTEHALNHIGQPVVVTCDINKFYNSLNMKSIIENSIFKKLLVQLFEDIYKVEFKIENFEDPTMFKWIKEVIEIYEKMFLVVFSFHSFNGMTPTGSYVSPDLSNLLFYPIDRKILAKVDTWKKNIGGDIDIRYTRYVDDLCFSSNRVRCDDKSYVLDLSAVKEIEQILNPFGLFLKYEKTKIMGPSDRKTITNLNLVNENKGKDNEFKGLSIGSKEKLALKQAYEGRKWADLSLSDKGLLNWIKTVNEEQYKFIVSGILEFDQSDIYKHILRYADGKVDVIRSKDIGQVTFQIKNQVIPAWAELHNKKGMITRKHIKMNSLIMGDTLTINYDLPKQQDTNLIF